MRVKLKWAKDFKPRHDRQFSKAQNYVDTARSEYYNHGKHTHTGNPKAQPMWFEVMKTKYKREIILGAAKLAGGKPK